LTALNVTGLSTGFKARVTSLDADFVLDLASSATVDGITVLATSGAGRWLRVIGPSFKWMSQLTWYVSNATGSDENSGAVGFPVKTMAEVARRLKSVQVSNYTINVLSDMPVTDSFDIAPLINDVPGGSPSATLVNINVVGQQTVAASGAVVAAVGSTPATNTPSTLQDASINWASYIGKIVKLTSGTLNGYTAVVVKDLGGNTARMSHWMLPAGTLAGIGVAPSVGVTFDILNFTIMGGGMRHAGAPTRLRYTYTDCQIPSTAALAVENMRVTWTTCEILTNFSGAGTLSFNSSPRFVGCAIKPAAPNMPIFVRLAVLGGATIGADLNCFNTGRIECNALVMQGGSFKVGRATAGFTIDTALSFGHAGIAAATYGLAVFDSPGNGLHVVRGGYMAVDGPLWGSGNLVGCVVDDCGQVYVRSTVTPVITGTTELSFEAAATAMPGLEASAGLVLPALSALATWANWVAAPFSRNVMSYTKGSKIISVAASS
jgi:hypothetical protein